MFLYLPICEHIFVLCFSFIFSNLMQTYRTLGIKIPYRFIHSGHTGYKKSIRLFLQHFFICFFWNTITTFLLRKIYKNHHIKKKKTPFSTFKNIVEGFLQRSDVCCKPRCCHKVDGYGNVFQVLLISLFATFLKRH